MGNRSKIFIIALSALTLWITVTFNACGEAEFSSKSGNDIQTFCQKNPEDSTCKNDPDDKNKVNIIDVNQGGKVDILFVVDNSWTMNHEHQNTAARIGNFLSHLNNLDWQIAVTTTNVSDVVAPGVDGLFVPLEGYSNKYILDKTFSNPQNTLGSTIQNGTMSSAVRVGDQLNYEQGIYAAYRTVQRYVGNEAPHNSFFRTGAQLAIVLISDEDEAMYMAGGPHNSLSGYHSSAGHKNKGIDLKSYVDQVFSSRKNLAFHSVIAISNSCLADEGESIGIEYESLSVITDGVIASVCSSDYASLLSSIGDSVVDKLKTASLECSPVNGAAGLTIEFQAPGSSSYVAYIGSYTLNGSQVDFAQELPLGKYKLSYQCP